jgi:hypothetical protein
MRKILFTYLSVYLVDMHGVMVDDNLDELGGFVYPEVDLRHGTVLWPRLTRLNVDLKSWYRIRWIKGIVSRAGLGFLMT